MSAGSCYTKTIWRFWKIIICVQRATTFFRSEKCLTKICLSENCEIFDGKYNEHNLTWPLHSGLHSLWPKRRTSPRTSPLQQLWPIFTSAKSRSAGVKCWIEGNGPKCRASSMHVCRRINSRLFAKLAPQKSSHQASSNILHFFRSDSKLFELKNERTNVFIDNSSDQLDLKLCAAKTFSLPKSFWSFLQRKERTCVAPTPTADRLLCIIGDYAFAF